MHPATAPKPSEAGLTKCQVYFADGAKKAFRSYDSSGRYAVADPRDYGIRGLKKMVDRWGKAVKMAILYDTEFGHELERYQHGQWQAPQP